MKQRPYLIYLCFFFSGAAGLIYEVVWSRQLGLFLGITSYAHTAVITAYMLGLALGSWWVGRRADQLSQPLRFYAWLEIGIALFAASTPWLFTVLQHGYTRWAGEIGVAGSGAHLSRFAIALIALLLPTFLMGGTLPLLVRGVMRELPQLGPVTGRLYGINTLGATLGTALTGFVLLPRIGMSNTIFFGVLINLMIGLLVLQFVPRVTGPKESAVKKVAQAEAPAPSSPMKAAQSMVLLGGFATAGFAALLTQVAWIRAMVLIVGGSVYAFTITLTSFLAGIGLGSLIYSHWLSHRQIDTARFRLAAVLACLIGFTSLLSLWLIGRLPLWFLLGYEAGWVENFAVYQLFIFALCFGVMIVPTILMGALFPLLAVNWTSGLHGAGRGIGSAYAINTLGTILGALLGGLLLLPWLGIQGSIILAASLYILVSIGFWLGGDERRPLTAAVVGILFISAVWLTPAWNRQQMGGGVFYGPAQILKDMRSMGLEQAFSQRELIYYKEGLHGTVAVTLDDYQKRLVINGKVDATSVGDLSTQVGLGQVAALMHPNPRDALIIGLGSGITVSSLAAHSSIEEITVLELSNEVVAASAFFAEENHNVLQDPRVKLISADARNYVLATPKQWDLVISEPSNPWVSGVSNLFTEDFFRLMKKKLAPGGIMTQWFHLYSVSSNDVKTLLNTFSRFYRHVTIWYFQGGDLVMTGSDQPHSLDMQRLQDAFGDPLIGAELNRAGLASPRDLLLLFFLADSALRNYVTGARLNTDNRPYIEFNAPRSMYTESSASNLHSIVRSVNNQKFSLPLTGQITQSPTALLSHTMNLEVSSKPGVEFTNVQTDWWLLRTLEDPATGTEKGIADMRVLTWNEADAQIMIEVVQDTSSPNASHRQAVLASRLTLPMVDGGNIVRANDPGALWLLGASPNTDRVDLALFWTCPSPDGGVNWFIVRYQLPGSAEMNPDALADSFASRFRC